MKTNTNPAAKTSTEIAWCVRLPDGSIGTVTRIEGDHAHVVHMNRFLGRGPWIFRVSQLAEPTDLERQLYATACLALL